LVVNNVTTVSSVNSLKLAIALAERQVQRDQSQVQQDSARLDQSQAQLARDQSQLNSIQDQSRAAAKTAPAVISTPKLDRAIQARLPAPQVNTQGQAIGTLINITA
jgi:hypothetical protein